jgi:hypothetical protein
VGWVLRHGHKVYIRSTRSGGRVRHQYFPAGAGAEAAAALDERRRRERDAQRDAREKRRREWDETNGPLGELAVGTDLLLAAKLLGLGYHRHDRGRWRARRRPLMKTANSTNAAPPPTAAPDVMQVLGDLEARAEAGDATAVEQISKVLDSHPEIWRRYGDLGRRIRSAWLRLAAGGEPVRIECTRKYVAEMEGELVGPNDGRLAKLLADRVVACWLQLQIADGETVAEANGSNAGLRKDAVARRALAERMFEKATKALATHQALVKPRLSPIDLVRPVDEKSPAARRSEFESSRRMAGVGVG